MISPSVDPDQASARQLVLACDVGNSRVKFGLFSVADSLRRPSELPACLTSFVTPAEGPLNWNALLADLQPFCGQNTTNFVGVLAGSHPNRRDHIKEVWTKYLGGSAPTVVSDPTVSGLRVAVDEPSKVGVDRLLNAVAVNAIRSAECGTIVIDCGTATTVDVVDGDGQFRGGAILPGFELSALSLHHYTALLPLISIDQLATESHAALGTNTRAAMRSGLFWGQIGAIKELVDRLSNQDGLFHRTPSLILTGGGAEMLAPHLADARWERHLSLQGLVLAGLAQADRETE